MDTKNWRAQLPPNARLLISRDLAERLYRYFLNSGQEVPIPSLEDLKKIAKYFERLVYVTSASWLQYMQQVYFMIWGVEATSRNKFPNPSGNHNMPLGSGALHILQPQVHNQAEPFPMLVSADPSSRNTPPSNTDSTVEKAILTSQNILISLSHNLTTEYSMGDRQLVVPELLQQKLRQGFQYVYQQILILTSHEQESLQQTRVKSQMAELTQQLKILLWRTSEQRNMQISSAMQPYMDQSANLSGPEQNQAFWTQESLESTLQHLQQDADFDRSETPMMQQPLLQNNLGNLHEFDWPELIAKNRMANMDNTYMSALFGFSTSEMNMMKSQQVASGLNSGQGNPVGPLPQNTFTAPPQANVTNFSSRSSVNMLRQNMPLQENPNMLQHQHPNQQLKQQELMKQQQGFNRKGKQHLHAKMQAHQMPQVHQRSHLNEIKIRQEMGVKPDLFKQHISGGHGTPYTDQQMKPGASFRISSPPLLPAASSRAAISNEKRKAEKKSDAGENKTAEKKK